MLLLKHTPQQQGTQQQQGKKQEIQDMIDTTTEQSPQILLQKKSQGNFKMLTEVVCLILHSPNLDFFRLPETHFRGAHSASLTKPYC